MAISVFDEFRPLQITNGSDRQTATFDPIPAGQILIVRFVSAQFLVPNGQRITVLSLNFETGGAGSHSHMFVPVVTGKIGLVDMVVASQHTHFYVESGVVITAFAIRESNTGISNGHMVVAGELVAA